MVLDGYGLNDRTEGNAIALANTPVMDKLMTSVTKLGDAGIFWICLLYTSPSPRDCS